MSGSTCEERGIAEQMFQLGMRNLDAMEYWDREEEYGFWMGGSIWYKKGIMVGGGETVTSELRYGFGTGVRRSVCLCGDVG